MCMEVEMNVMMWIFASNPLKPSEVSSSNHLCITIENWRYCSGCCSTSRNDNPNLATTRKLRCVQYKKIPSPCNGHVQSGLHWNYETRQNRGTFLNDRIHIVCCDIWRCTIHTLHIQMKEKQHIVNQHMAIDCPWKHLLVSYPHNLNQESSFSQSRSITSRQN